MACDSTKLGENGERPCPLGRRNSLHLGSGATGHRIAAMALGVGTCHHAAGVTGLIRRDVQKTGVRTNSFTATARLPCVLSKWRVLDPRINETSSGWVGCHMPTV